MQTTPVPGRRTRLRAGPQLLGPIPRWPGGAARGFPLRHWRAIVTECPDTRFHLVSDAVDARTEALVHAKWQAIRLESGSDHVDPKKERFADFLVTLCASPSRQMLPVAAAWLACVIALCGRSGVNSMCTFEALGERGLIYAEPTGEQTALSPTALVLQELAKHQGASVAGVRLEAHQYGVFTLAGARHTLWVVELAGCALCLPLAHLSPISVHVLARRKGAFGWRPVSVGKELVQLQAYQIVRLDLPTPAWGDGVLSAVTGGLVRPPVCRPAGGTPASDFGDCMHNSANGG